MDNQGVSTVFCRTARPSDEKGILGVTRQLWDGDDYVPAVLEKWLNDTSGHLAVAECEGKIVGVAKLTRITEQDWWLEGLRVHPDWEGRGIASSLHREVVGHWEREGSGVLRLITSSERFAVHRLCEKTGFQKLGEYSCFHAYPLAESARYLRQACLSECEMLWNMIQTPQNGYARHQGIVDLSWLFAKLTVGMIYDMISKQLVWRFDSNGEANGVVIAHENWEKPQPRMTAALVACPQEQLKMLLEDVLRLASHDNYTQVLWNSQDGAQVEPCARRAGFDTSAAHRVILFERETR